MADVYISSLQEVGCVIEVEVIRVSWHSWKSLCWEDNSMSMVKVFHNIHLMS